MNNPSVTIQATRPRFLDAAGKPHNHPAMVETNSGNNPQFVAWYQPHHFLFNSGALGGWLTPLMVNIRRLHCMWINVFALFIWAAGFCPATAASGDTNKLTLKWGAAISGLQMAALPDARAGFVHCWIRNAETNAIAYNRYYLGYFGAVCIEVHYSNAWVRLERGPSPVRYYASAGPSPRDLERLSPLQVITNPVATVWADDRFGAWAATTNAGGIKKTREQRADLPSPASLGGTFGVDLGDFQWTPSLLHDTNIEVRIIQQLSGPGHNGPIAIRSAPVQLAGRELRTFIERLHRDDSVLWELIPSKQ